MDRDRQRKIASKGGIAAHEQGTAHEWDSDEARDAGRKGGFASARAARARRRLQDQQTPSSPTGDPMSSTPLDNSLTV